MSTSKPKLSLSLKVSSQSKPTPDKKKEKAVSKSNEGLSTKKLFEDALLNDTSSSSSKVYAKEVTKESKIPNVAIANDPSLYCYDEFLVDKKKDEPKKTRLYLGYIPTSTDSGHDDATIPEKASSVTHGNNVSLEGKLNLFTQDSDRDSVKNVKLDTCSKGTRPGYNKEHEYLNPTFEQSSLPHGIPVSHSAAETQHSQSTLLSTVGQAGIDHTSDESHLQFDHYEPSNDEPPSLQNQKRQSRYISSLLQAAQRRTVEQEIIQERVMHKELKREEALYGQKEAFITPAYERKLKARQIIEAQLKNDEQKELLNDITKKRDLSALHANLLSSGKRYRSNAVTGTAANSNDLETKVDASTGVAAHNNAAGGAGALEWRAASSEHHSGTDICSDNILHRRASDATQRLDLVHKDSSTSDAAMTLCSYTSVDLSGAEQGQYPILPAVNGPSKQEKLAFARERYMDRKRMRDAEKSAHL